MPKTTGSNSLECQLHFSVVVLGLVLPIPFLSYENLQEKAHMFRSLCRLLPRALEDLQKQVDGSPPVEYIPKTGSNIPRLDASKTVQVRAYDSCRPRPKSTRLLRHVVTLKPCLRFAWEIEKVGLKAIGAYCTLCEQKRILVNSS